MEGMIGTKVLINFLKDFFSTNHGKQHTQPYLFGERKNKTNYLKKVKDRHSNDRRLVFPVDVEVTQPPHEWEGSKQRLGHLP